MSVEPPAPASASAEAEAEAKTAKKRPRIDMAVEPRERKRGKTMFGLVLGTLTKAKNEDKERNASDAVRLAVFSPVDTCADCRSRFFVLCCPCAMDVVYVCANVDFGVRWDSAVCWMALLGCVGRLTGAGKEEAIDRTEVTG